MKVSSLRFLSVLVLSLFLFGCKEEKPNYKFSFFNDIDKIEHVTFEITELPQKVESKEESKPKIISSKIISKNDFKDLFEVLSTENEECTLMKCYFPRDILYFYKNGKKVGFYEFCKECGGSKTSKNLEKLPVFCREKVSELESILSN